jgi:hypothetical protein
MANKKGTTRKVGRSAIDGHFMSVEKARKQHDTAIVQHITYPKHNKKKK